MCALCSSERLIWACQCSGTRLSRSRWTSRYWTWRSHCCCGARTGSETWTWTELHNIEIEVVCNATKCLILPEFFRVGLVQTQLAQVLFPFWELGGWEIVWRLVFMRLDELLLLAGLLQVEVDGVRVVGLEGAGVRAWLAGAGERGHGLLLPLPLSILCSLHLNIEHPKLQHWH